VNETAGSGPVHPELWLFDDAPIFGGAEVFAIRLARFLTRRGAPSVRIVSPARSELAERCRADGIPCVHTRFPELGLRGLPLWPGAVARVRSLLREAGPKAIAIGNSPRAQGYLTAAAPLVRRGPAVVQVVHEQETLRRVSGRLAFRRVGSLVAMGGNLAAACERHLPGVPVREANLFLDVPVEPVARREDPGEPVVGMLTRLIPEKGIIELTEELAAARSWSRAVIAGVAQDARYARRVEQRIGQLGIADRVTMPGHVEDLRSFFASIDVLIVPSTGTEGQGMGTVEALWYGRPSLVRRSAFSARDFEGLPVLPFEGAAELAEGLRRLPGSEIAQEVVRERFGPEQALRAILDARAGERR
jgi:glycosyltransferase involved in cell wall biosynthesis